MELICPRKCGKKFKTEKDLLNHMKEEHPEVKTLFIEGRKYKL